MIVRIAASILLVWALGFVLFAVTLPSAADDTRTDAIVVPTGGKGRIARGLDMLERGHAKRMLITGVDRTVRSRELAATTGRPRRLFECCVDLGREAVDTRSNGKETADWLAKRRYKSVRLVTTDWHMPRARFELEHALGDSVRIVPDAVPSMPGFAMLLREYNKYLLRRISVVAGL